MTTPKISLDAVKFFGSRFARPECVLCTKAGDVFTSDRRGGVSHITPSGEHKLYTGATLDLSWPLYPNGIALDRDGSFLIAQLIDGEGGVFRLYRDGRLVPLLREVDGVPLHVTNFVLIDAHDRIWVTICTRHNPRVGAFKPTVADGYIVLIDKGCARIVADGIGLANECRIDPTGTWLYINETYARCLTRFRIGTDGSLSQREVVARLGVGEFPDGLTFDADGGAWITCIVTNRLIRVGLDGRPDIVLEDNDPAHVAEVEAAYQAGSLERALLDRHSWQKLAHISSLAFFGADLRQAYLGVLLDSRLPVLDMPVQGHPPVHWDWGTRSS